MRLQDLKFLKKKPPIDPESTRLLINRVQSFLQTAESSAPPEGFENSEDTQRHIELNLFIPKEDDESNSSLLLPIDTTLGSGSSSSSTTSSSDASDAEEIPAKEKLLDSAESPPAKRSKVEEIDRISDTDDEENTTSSGI